MVRLEGYGDRKPGQLSGGQRQRVAPARAIVNTPRPHPDEPLGALDLKLRQELQIELKQIQQELGMTFIYVTHDQEEALTMSDRIAVFNQGQDRADRHARRDVRASDERSSSPASSARRTSSSATGARSRCGPEKIRLSTDEAAEGEPGVITAAVYLGPVTKFIVALDGGGELTVVQQNLETSSEDVREMERKRVRLRWSPRRGIRDRRRRKQ